MGGKTRAGSRQDIKRYYDELRRENPPKVAPGYQVPLGTKVADETYSTGSRPVAVGMGPATVDAVTPFAHHSHEYEEHYSPS